MKRIAVEGDFSGQMASGNIVNNGFCPGRDACPFERREEDRQYRFEKTTGIACSAGARLALEHLLDTGAFSYKQLASAWRVTALYWDIEKHELKTDFSRVEFYGGLALMSLGLLSFIIGLVSLVFSSISPLTWQQIQGSVLLMLSVAGIPFFARFSVGPNKIARRITPYLQEFYASPR